MNAALGKVRSLAILVVLAATLMGTPELVYADPACLFNVRLPLAPTYCSETVLSGFETQGIASVTAITFGPDGTLYFARPATRQIVRMVPDGKGFFSPPQSIADNLPEPPNGVTYDAQAGATWYVSADTMIIRLHDTNGDGLISADEMQVIVRDLPGGEGGWLGNIRIGPDRRLYVAKAIRCDECVDSDSRRGALLSFALDGSDMRIVARGLRNAFDMAWSPVDGTLYIADDAPPDDPARLNAITKAQLEAGQTVDFKTTPAVLTFDKSSHPTGLAFYQSKTLDGLDGNLFVALAGSWNATTTAGFAVMRVLFDVNGKPTGVDQFLPEKIMRPTLADQSLYEISFYPYHATGVAISAEGWVYISESEGKIVRFRPRPDLP